METQWTDYPLSANQRLYWLIDKMHPAGRAYNIPSVFKIEGPLDVEALEQALNRVVEAHGIFRTLFIEKEGMPWQRVFTSLPLTPGVLSLEGWEENPREWEIRLKELLKEEINRPFDLARGPLMRGRVYKAGENLWFLALTAHHVIFDLRTKEIFARDFAAWYSHYTTGSPPPGQPESQYRDYSLSSEKWLSGEKALRMGEYWKKETSSLEGIPLIPSDRPHPPVQSLDGGEVVFRLTGVSYEKIQQFLKREVSDSFVFFLTLYFMFLYRLTGESRITAGVPLTARRKEEYKEVAGCVMNILPIAPEIRGEMSFRELLKEVRMKLLFAHRNQEYPLEKIVEDWGRPRSMAYNPLFQYGFTFEHPMPLVLPGLEVAPFSLPLEGAQLDLFMNIHQSPQGVEGKLIYKKDLFIPATVRGFLNIYLTLLRGVLSRPEKSINRFSLVSRKEMEYLREWNRTNVLFDMDRCIHHFLETNARRFPEKDAVLFGDRKLTYDQLNRKANKIAHFLLKILKPGSIVGVLVERSLELSPLLFGILKAGCAYLPLDPAHPPERTAYILEDGEVGRVVTTKPLESLLPRGEWAIHTLEEIEESGQDDDDPGLLFSPGAPAYIIYTSGSTGKPKGVIIEHHSLVNRLQWMQKHNPIGPGDTLLQKTPITFDVSLWELFWWSFYGARVLFLAPGEEKIPGAIEKAIVHYRISVIHFVPSMLEIFLNHLKEVKELSGEDPGRLGSLRRVYTSGEALTPGQAELFRTLLYPSTRTALTNLYGPTEATVDVSCFDIDLTAPVTGVPIGRPIDNVQLWIVDPNLELLPPGVPGELVIGGLQLARGYLNRPELTRSAFIQSPAFEGVRWYRTGDICRLNPAGELDYLGRNDSQVKIRGYRIELGEIEKALAPLVEKGVILVEEGEEKLLAAYLVPFHGQILDSEQLKGEMKKSLPSYMVPSRFYQVERMPLSPNGKIDRKALKNLKTSPVTGGRPPAKPRELLSPGGMEEVVAREWMGLLESGEPDYDTNFFDAGGNSFLLLKLCSRLSRLLGVHIDPVPLFAHPTIRRMAAFLSGHGKISVLKREKRKKGTGDIAVIGAACRLPGASSLEEFWELILQGEERITLLSEAELEEFEPGYEDLKKDPHYIPARGVLEKVEMFDPHFFGITPAEAAVMDPQLRIWLELVWEALENAGAAGIGEDNRIGVFAGSYFNNYLFHNVLGSREEIENWLRLRGAGSFHKMINNHSSFLPTRTSYLFNLKGPSVNIQTACSTSLTAIVEACRSIREGHADMAIAGGISIVIPQEAGYLYQEGSIPSRDGHCFPFDARATGTVLSSGGGVVILKSLEKAMEEGDYILGVIKGGAINNDGSRKVSFTAPSIEGQEDVILAAQEDGGIDPRSIGYIEAHGTGTPLGDPVEFKALTSAFRRNTGARGFCALGSVKHNVGHLDAAAGVTGFIKVLLALKNRQIPPSPYFEKPNPRIDLENSPFFISREGQPWKGEQRRGAVSSFGLGGTNAHVILEEFIPRETPPIPEEEWELFLFSAPTPRGLELLLENFAAFVQKREDLNLKNSAHTLRTGRKEFPHRAYALAPCKGNELFMVLSEKDPRFMQKGSVKKGSGSLVFLFPGQGSFYPEMGKVLYEREPYFREVLDRCAALSDEYLDRPLKEILFSRDVNFLSNNIWAQLGIFCFEYSLARFWIHLGLEPDMMVGHSLGEWVAAAVSGVISLEEGIRVIYHRGRLMETVPEKGKALSVGAEEERVREFLSGKVALAAVNSPRSCVISGPVEEVDRCANELTTAEIPWKQLALSIGVHSSLMDPVLEPFREILKTLNLKAPEIPFLSCVTGTWIKSSEACDPEYWVSHIRRTVRFSDAVTTIVKEGQGGEIFLEVGARNALSSLARHQVKARERVISSLDSEGRDERRNLLKAAGKLWLLGLSPRWIFFPGEGEKVPLPSYPFERKPYWIDPPGQEKERVYHEEPTLVDTDLSQEDEVKGVILRELKALSGEEEIPEGLTFPEMGFDSLFLARFASRLEELFGVPVKFRQLSVDYPSPGLLSPYLSGQGNKKKRFKNLGLLKPDGIKTPFVMVHGDFSNKFLPSYLDPERPFYGYFHQGADGEEIALTSVEDIAFSYLEELKKIQPLGPYILGGFSYGGLVAFEMARLLRSRGEKVDLLVMMDTVYPQSQGFKDLVMTPRRFIKRFLAWLPVTIYHFWLFRRKIPGLIRRGKAVPVKWRSKYITHTYEESSLSYFPQSLDVPVLMFRATGSVYKNTIPGWRRIFTGSVEVVDVPGTHLGIIRKTENLCLIGDRLKEALDKLP